MLAEPSNNSNTQANATDEPLKIELEYFNEVLQELLAENDGRYAVVYGRSVHSCWDTWNDAIQAGYMAYGLKQFMVRQVLLIQPELVIHSLPGQFRTVS